MKNFSCRSRFQVTILSEKSNFNNDAQGNIYINEKIQKYYVIFMYVCAEKHSP